MKRTTVLNRKGRRSNKGEKESSSSCSSANDGGGNNNESVQKHVEPPVRRKATTEEAQLTAKNYRLAKELSDLRCRHREECKNVSRLTMENMNLASRWRDAVNHVNMLKKEVALNKQRAVDAESRHQELLAQRSQSNNTGAVTPPAKPASLATEKNSPMVRVTRGSSMQDVAKEMDRMDRLLADHSSGSQQQQQSAELNSSPVLTAETAQLSKSSSSPLANSTPRLTSTNSQHDLLRGATLSDDSSDGGEKNNQSQDPVTPSPERADTSPASETDVNENFFAVFDGDDLMGGDFDDDPPLESPESSSPSESPSPSLTTPHDKGSEDDNNGILPIMKTPSNIFPRTASPHVGFSYDEEFPSDISADVTKHPRSVERKSLPDFNDIEEEDGPSLQMTGDNISSIDAFEASFATKFPESFSPGDAKKTTNPAGSPEEELYNPFFPSPSLEKTKASDGAVVSGESPRSARSEGDKSLATARSSSNSKRAVGDSSPAPAEGNTDDSSPSRRLLVASSPPPSGATRADRSQTVNSWTLPSSGSLSPAQQTTSSSNSSSDKSYHTPPQETASPEVLRPVVVSEFPRRPEKAGAAAARARYEKALQPRGYVGGSRRYSRAPEHDLDRGAYPVISSNDNLIAEKLGVDAEKLATAKSRVLERTSIYTGRTPPPPSDEKPSNARRTSWTVQADSPAGESGGSKPWDEVGDIPLGDGASSVRSASPKIHVTTNANSSPRQPLGQNRPWDSLGNRMALVTDSADGSSISPSNSLNGGGRSRRNVKQPVSYAEPSLSAKLRKGDVFFPKDPARAGEEVAGQAQQLQNVTSSQSVH